MNSRTLLINLFQVLIIATVGVGLGLQLWDRLPNLLGLGYFPIVTWLYHLCGLGWICSVSGYVFFLQDHPSIQWSPRPKIKGLVLILLLWLFTTLGAMGTFYQGLDYMTIPLIVAGSAYSAAAANFGFILLPAFVVYGTILVARRNVRAQSEAPS